jgi:hypothetical protein
MTEPSKETESEILARRQVEALERIAEALEQMARTVYNIAGVGHFIQVRDAEKP